MIVTTLLEPIDVIEVLVNEMHSGR